MQITKTRILALILVALVAAFPLLFGPRAVTAATAPDVINVTPRTGPTTGGFTVTLFGTGFTGATSVSFGAVSVTPSVSSDNFLTVVAPAHAAGVVHVKVTNPLGTSPDSDADDDFTYVNTAGPAPAVLAITPSSGPTAGGTVVTIVGQHFTGALFVDFDGQQIVPGSITDSQLTVTTPAHAAGVVHLRVQTASGLSAPTAADNYRYLGAPVVTSVTPNTGPPSGGTSVVIEGSSFTGAYQVLFGGTPAAPWQVSDSAVYVIAPAHAAGTVDVRVRTPGGLSAITTADQFTYGPVRPVIASVTPASGPTSGGALVTIRGSGFSGATGVSFGVVGSGGVLVAPAFVSETEIRVIAPPHAPGSVALTVVTPAGSNAQPPFFSFTYVVGLPVVQQVSPRSGPVEGGTLITITGAGFSGAVSVRFGVQLVTPSTVTETVIQVVAPPHAAGVVHLRVSTALATSEESALDDYTYGGGGPRVTGIAPTHGPTSGGTVVTITGTGFSGAFGVLFGDALIAPSLVTGTQVVVTAPARAPGVVHLRVVTAGGASPETALDNYTYDGGAPVVTGISPASGSLDGGTVVTINGSGLSGTTSVSFGDAAATPLSVSENQVRVVSPAATTSGVVHLRVTANGVVSGETPADNFTYVGRPRVTAVSPKTGSTAGGTAVVISGAGFTGTTVVNFGGIGVLPSLVTDSEIRVTSPAHAAGVVHLRITSSGGISAETADDDFTFAVPGPEFCPALPLWVNDLAYGSIGGGFYWDPVSGQVWTGQRGWHNFAPQPARPAPQPLWVNALTYGSIGGGFYWDPVSGQVWTGQRGWHAYSPQGCVPRP